MQREITLKTSKGEQKFAMEKQELFFHQGWRASGLS